VVKVNEIKKYLDCHYVSTSEGAWRIFKFDMHERFPTIERLQLIRPQVPCVTQKGSKELDLRNWLETWCRSQLPALKGVEGSCWKLRESFPTPCRTPASDVGKRSIPDF
jgi:hypothetical protein